MIIKNSDNISEKKELLRKENIKLIKTKIKIKNILFRFLYSLYPFNFNFKSTLNNTPDIIGPFFLITLIIILSFFLFKDSYIVSDNKIINNMIIFSFLFLFVYLFVFCIILLTVFTLRFLGKSTNFRFIIYIAGYSLSIFIPIIILNLIFGNKRYFIFRFLLILYGIVSSFLLNFFNNIEIIYMNNLKFKRAFILSLLYEILISLILYLAINKINFLYLKPHIINIAMSSNDEYKYPSLVLITSLLENIDIHSFYQIYFMVPNDNTKDNIINLLNSLIPKYGKKKFNITYLPIDSSALSSNITISGHISRETYYRLLLPSLLPQLDRVLYIDTDVINLEDLTELYNLELKDNIYIKGVLSRYSHLEQLKQLNVNAEYNFNAGILLINLKSFRKYNIEKKLLDFISTHDLTLHDQTALNAICYKNNELIHPKYNYMAFSSFKSIKKYYKGNDKKYEYTDEELKEALNFPVNIHYASPGGAKPWNKKPHLSKREYWWYYANKTDYMKEIMVFANYSQELVDAYLTQI